MSKKTFVPKAVESAATLGVTPPVVAKRAMIPLSQLEIKAVAGGPQVVNHPPGG